MISLTRLRDLGIISPNGRRGFVSAASGLVRAGGYFHVVGDDALHLASFPVAGDQPGRLLRLLDGRLPEAPAARKKHKPDFETLLALPATPQNPHGALLALGSGSRPNRRRGVAMTLEADGKAGASHVADLTPLLAPLDGRFSETNIEGAAILGEQLLLFQRGNAGAASNALVAYPLAAVLQLLADPTAGLSAPDIRMVDLGTVDGVPLSFTDAATLDDGRIVFSAVAEDTSNAYDDGALVGAVVGLVDRAGTIIGTQPLSPTVKVEGIDARLAGDSIQLNLVTDADNPDIAASLYQAALKL